MLFFVGQILPYIAAAIFVIGIFAKLAVWLKAPVPFELTLFPAAKTGSGRMLAIGREVLLFDSLWRGDRWLWLWSWLMHVSLALIIIGHIVGIYYLTKQFTLIGMSGEASSSLSAALGIISGTIMFVCLVALFYRRTADPELKRLTDPADYFDLLLLAAIVVTGMHMRLISGSVDLEAVRTYMGGLLTIQPVPIPDNGIFISHFTLVMILLIYFPFSKMIHLAGMFVNRMIITQPPPVYPTPAGFSSSALFRKEAGNEK